MHTTTPSGPGAEHADETPPPVPFGRALVLWLRIGLLSFGGPAGQIAMLHTELVERRRWIPPARFERALQFCMLLPGPEAQQLATYSGWILHGVRGGLAAGSLFVLPSAILLWALAYLHAAYGTDPRVASVLGAFQPAVVAIVALALWNLARRSLKRPYQVVLAIGALVALALGAPFPAIVLGAGLVGFVAGRLGGGAGGQRATSPPGAADGAAAASPTAKRGLGVLVLGLALWAAPVLAVAWIFGADSVFVEQGTFFSKAALVTFGGAYAVLPYVAEHAVEVYGWVGAEDVMVSLALAETTPGPLIMMTQFIGFLGGWHRPGELAPWQAATVGAALTTWVTFVPCFLWIFLFAPHMERLGRRPALANALAGILAAVVGVIAHLALWFAAHTFYRGDGGDGGDTGGPSTLLDFGPDSGWRPAAILLALLAFALLRHGRIALHWVVLLAGLVGLAAGLLGWDVF
jgi:chromate transporter